MKTGNRIIEGIIPRLNIIAAYAATLYYFEILLLMPGVLALFGKTAAVLTGFTLTALLSVHIIMLFLKKEKNRVIHLFIMDLHAAASLAFIAVVLFRGAGNGLAAGLVVSVRVLILFIEVPLLCLMTGTGARHSFS